MLLNADELFSVMDRHHHVRCLLWGHIHQEYDSKRKAVRLLATPSTCVQFNPKTPQFSVDLKPPGCRLLELYDDGTVSTTVIRADKLPAGLDMTSAGY